LTPTDRRGCHSEDMQLSRLAWLMTTVACLLAAAVVLIRGDRGYAAVAFAVAVSAATNLF
jgi:hypothetical protein